MSDKNKKKEEPEISVEELLEKTAAVPEDKPTLDVDGLGAWSVSKLKTLQQCPLQFYLRYVLKLKIPKPLDDDTLLADLGTARHDVLDLLAQGMSMDKAMARVEVSSRAYLDPEEWHQVEETRFNMEYFWQKIEEFKIRNKVKAIYPEKKIGVTKDWGKSSFFGKDVFFRGIIDLVLQMENGDVVIIDHKSGGSTQYGTKHHDFQLKTYLPMFHFGIEPIRGGQTGINFIKAGEYFLNPYTHLDEIEEKIPNEINFYLETAIQAVEDKGMFKQKSCNICKYCDYKDLCKGGKRGTANKLEKFVSGSAELINIKEL